TQASKDEEIVEIFCAIAKYYLLNKVEIDPNWIEWSSDKTTWTYQNRYLDIEGIESDDELEFEDSNYEIFNSDYTYNFQLDHNEC
ncbi:24636_t:CDS:2, partial [Racocetra persica]